MKKLVLSILALIIAISCICVLFACNSNDDVKDNDNNNSTVVDDETPLEKWDIAQFYGAYENTEQSVSAYLESTQDHMPWQNYVNRFDKSKLICYPDGNPSQSKEIAYSDVYSSYVTIATHVYNWANQYMDGFTTGITIEKNKISVGDFSFENYESTFVEDEHATETGDDGYYVLSAENDEAKLSITARYVDNQPIVFIDFLAEKSFYGLKYTLGVYNTLFKNASPAVVKQTYFYTPEYASAYTFEQKGVKEFYLNGVKQSPQDGKYIVLLKQDDEYIIDLFGSQSRTLDFVCQTAGETTTISVDFDDTYIIRFRPTEENVYKIDCGENAVISKIEYDKNDVLNNVSFDGRYRFDLYYYRIIDSSVFEHVFEKNVDYVLYIKKIQDVEDDITVNISTVSRILNLGENEPITIGANSQSVVYKFVTPADVDVQTIHTISYSADSKISSCILNNDVYVDAYVNNGNVNVNAFSLEPNKTYYFFAKNSTSSPITTSFTYSLSQTEYILNVYQDDSETIYTSSIGAPISLPREHSYRFEFIENNNRILADHLKVNGDVFFNFDSNVLTINKGVSCDMSLYIYYISSTGMNHCFTIKTAPNESDFAIDKVSFSEENTIVDVILPYDAISFDYKVSGYDSNGNYVSVTTTKTNNSNAVDITNILIENNIVSDIEFELYSVKFLKSDNMSEKYYYPNIVVSCDKQ